ncbi:MAG: phosphotransferase family protein [Gammaproteobacteria bacterium]|nr:phosphotransferase family protein [Gammaproteobacteria bacterium]
MPVAARREAWFDGIRAVARLARLDWRAAGLGFLATAEAAADDGREPLDRQLDHYAAAIRWAEERAGREYPLLRAAEPWLRANRPAGAPVAFSWGDAKLGNCLYRDGRLVAMLDFEQATLTHPVDDLAWWLMLDDSLSRGYGVPRLEGLPTRAESVAAWEAESGLVARDLDYLEVFAAWRMAFVMARIAFLFRARGWIPADSDMDVRNGGATLLAAHGARLGFAAADAPRAGG